MKTFKRIESLNGEVTVPADKSITHRSFMFSAMAEGKSVVVNPLMSRDTIATMNAMKALGAEFKETVEGFIVESKGYRNFIEPFDVINCDNSGTTSRLISGILAPQNKYIVLTGDNSLKKRPMGRVIKPLMKLGANIRARENDKFLPMTILPSKMKGGKLTAETKSAQVKSCVILAALQIPGNTVYKELVQTRNHTEIMLKSFGVELNVKGGDITIPGESLMTAGEVIVPSDISSAAFFLGAALMFDNAEITIKNVGLNPTRTGIIDILESFGVKMEITRLPSTGEPRGDIFIKNQPFSGGKVKGDIIANAIDELMMVATLGLFADSPVEIRGAEELRVKESDRIKATVYNLRQLGAEVEEFEDGMKVYPLQKLKNKIELKSFDDHRIAMINILLAKKFGENITLDDIKCIDVSFPSFVKTLGDIEVK